MNIHLGPSVLMYKEGKGHEQMHVFTCMFMYVHVCTCMCMYVHVCVCMSMYVHVSLLGPSLYILQCSEVLETEKVVSGCAGSFACRFHSRCHPRNTRLELVESHGRPLIQRITGMGYGAMLLCVGVRMYVCIYIYIHVCMHACMYASMHVSMYACMHVCMYACMCVYMYACMHVYMQCV